MSDIYSVEEIALAAGVTDYAVTEALRAGYVTSFNGFVPAREAALLVRILAAGQSQTGERPVFDSREPASGSSMPRRSAGLAVSGVLHAVLLVALLTVASLGLLDASDTEQLIKNEPPTKLVYMVAIGPGGGGGGGGLKMPAPPPRAQRKPIIRVVRRAPSPVPPVRRTPPRPQRTLPERPMPPPELEPWRTEPLRTLPPKPAPPQSIQAPVVSIPTDPIDLAGVLTDKNGVLPSNGPGTGGGVGSGAGTGIGEGQGGGIGPGTGGGVGGGAFQPGTGIDPPVLIREVRPNYTDEARRRRIEGDVMLEIVVRRDGTVGDVRVVRSLGAGLEQRAIDAVRQWRFGPARRQGTPLDIIVEVAVEFKLR